MKIAAVMAVALLCSCVSAEEKRKADIQKIIEDSNRRWDAKEAEREAAFAQRKAEDAELLDYDVVMDSPGGPAVWGNGSTVRLRDMTGVGMYESYTRLTRRLPLIDDYRVRIVERRVTRLPDAFLVQYKVRFPPESGIKKEMWVESDDIWPPDPEHMD